MTNRDIVAIGASAGGVEALRYLFEKLPPQFPASILVTQHLPSQYQSSLDRILSPADGVAVSFAVDGETPRKAHIYLAPPDRHLLIDGDKLHLGTGPRENNSRPAIDPMLRSVGLCCGGRSIGIVLTGTLSDGASGLWALRKAGGIAVVQDPKDAPFPEMPRNALALSGPQHIATLSDMPHLLDSLTHQSAGPNLPLPGRIRFEVETAKTGHYAMEKMDHLGSRSVLTCPDCGGVMWEIEEGDLMRFRCHVGHAYTAEVLSLAEDESVRRALQTAMRGFEERLALLKRMEERAVENGHKELAKTWRSRAQEYQEQASILTRAIQRLDDVAQSNGG